MFGFILFTQLPDWWSVLGYVVICGMSIAMYYYNRREDSLTECGKTCVPETRGMSSVPR